jgi:hypothetical protein
MMKVFSLSYLFLPPPKENKTTKFLCPYETPLLCIEIESDHRGRKADTLLRVSGRK